MGRMVKKSGNGQSENCKGHGEKVPEPSNKRSNDHKARRPVCVGT